MKMVFSRKQMDPPPPIQIQQPTKTPMPISSQINRAILQIGMIDRLLPATNCTSCGNNYLPK